MSFNLGEFFGGVGDALWDEAGKLADTVVPGLTAAGASYVADQLYGIAADQKQVAEHGMNQILNAPPSDPNSLGGYVSNMFSQIGANAGLRTYAPYIIGGVVLIGVAAVFVFGGRK